MYMLYLVQLDQLIDVSKYLFHQHDWKRLDTKTGALINQFHNILNTSK